MSVMLAEPRAIAAGPHSEQARDAAVAALRRHQAVVHRDAAGGHLVASARGITAETVNSMIRIGRGILMLAITPERALALGLRLQPRRRARAEMPLCTVSVEAAAGTTTGISAADRSLTLRTAAGTDCVASMLVSPGHIFPVVAGKTAEIGGCDFVAAAIDLVGQALGHDTAACMQILDDRGEVLAGDALARFARIHKIALVDIVHVRSW